MTAPVEPLVGPLPTDTEMLDFLERTKQPLYTVVQETKRWRTTTEPGVEVEWRFLGWCVGHSTVEYPTPREAIARAMASKPSDCLQDPPRPLSSSARETLLDQWQ